VTPQEAVCGLLLRQMGGVSLTTLGRAKPTIICHNHSSGIGEPSGADIELTQHLVAAGILLGIPLEDHFIINQDGVF